MELVWDAVSPVVARLLGREASDPQDLGGSSRTVVWRVRVGTTPYVVKVHREDAAAGYARECSALEVLGGTGTVPALLAHDDATRTIVMEDLGDGPHLAAALLGDDRQAARGRLRDWADALARLHGAATPERIAAFRAAARRRGATAGADIEEQPGMSAERYAEVLPGLDVPGLVPAFDDVRTALRRVPELLGDDLVISPGDVCPDNNAVVGDQLLLLDLEGAQLLHPAWDLAYLTVPWPSCWCSWAMPPDEVEVAVGRYLAATGGGPRLRQDLALTTLTWSVVSPGWFLPRALRPHPSDAGDERHLPTRRAMVQHRLAQAARSTVPDELVALPEFAGRLHAALAERWGEVTLPLGRAWRGTTLTP